ncbi:uncharacterized protein LY89DRAFT_672614 [Mollisia scopiformis]|uniref:Uncharacterized protein n=1 Tax=Mollisia scopiformis TaxID=149040 RepID=A0A194X0B1_MOLSC|nr:uncharacterized protein LY89DRAFT_672614 [Mollisia scopiformis]KUJ13633.1 hypothetical protein LY89DRAFT_672614 [Mollisia scopiformis]
MFPSSHRITGRPRKILIRIDYEIDEGTPATATAIISISPYKTLEEMIDEVEDIINKNRFWVQCVGRDPSWAPGQEADRKGKGKAREGDEKEVVLKGYWEFSPVLAMCCEDGASNQVQVKLKSDEDVSAAYGLLESMKWNGYFVLTTARRPERSSSDSPEHLEVYDDAPENPQD